LFTYLAAVQINTLADICSTPIIFTYFIPLRFSSQKSVVFCLFVCWSFCCCFFLIFITWSKYYNLTRIFISISQTNKIFKFHLKYNLITSGFPLIFATINTSHTLLLSCHYKQIELLYCNHVRLFYELSFCVARAYYYL
jgi:hypothetical protein